MKSIGMLIGLSFVFTSCIQARPAYADHSRHPVVVTHIDHSPDQRHRKKVKVKKIVIGTRVKARPVNCIVIRIIKSPCSTQLAYFTGRLMMASTKWSDPK